jgi:hypothetical protein
MDVKYDPGFWGGVLIGLLGGVIGNFASSSLMESVPDDSKGALGVVSLIFFTFIVIVLWVFFRNSVQKQHNRQVDKHVSVLAEWL